MKHLNIIYNINYISIGSIDELNCIIKKCLYHGHQTPILTINKSIEWLKIYNNYEKIKKELYDIKYNILYSYTKVPLYHDVIIYILSFDS